MRALTAVLTVLLLAAPAALAATKPPKAKRQTCGVTTAKGAAKRAARVKGAAGRQRAAANKRACTRKSVGARRPVAGRPPVAERTAPAVPVAAVPVASAPSDLLEPPGPVIAPAPDAVPPASSGPNAIGVSAWDEVGTDGASHFVLRLTRTTVRAGSLLVSYQNRDSAMHDLRAGDAQVFAPLESGAAANTTITVSPGPLRLVCTLHAGMERTITVQ